MPSISILEPEDYPDITLCPFPSHNQTTLESYGYKNTYHYAKESMINTEIETLILKGLKDHTTIVLITGIYTLHIIDHLFEGIIHGSYLQGWSGNSSLTTTEEIIQKISLFRTSEDCPYARVELLDRNNDKKHFVPLAFELTSMLHPAGQCCQAVIPEQASKWIINGLLVSIKPKLNSLLGKP